MNPCNHPIVHPETELIHLAEEFLSFTLETAISVTGLEASILEPALENMISSKLLTVELGYSGDPMYEWNEEPVS